MLLQNLSFCVDMMGITQRLPSAKVRMKECYDYNVPRFHLNRELQPDIGFTLLHEYSGRNLHGAVCEIAYLLCWFHLFD